MVDLQIFAPLYLEIFGRVDVLEAASTKETAFQRADFTLQLLMFVTVEKERRIFIIFFLSSFGQLVPAILILS